MPAVLWQSSVQRTSGDDRPLPGTGIANSKSTSSSTGARSVVAVAILLQAADGCAHLRTGNLAKASNVTSSEAADVAG